MMLNKWFVGSVVLLASCTVHEPNNVTMLMRDPNAHLCGRHVIVEGPDGPDSLAMNLRVFRGACPTSEPPGWYEIKAVGFTTDPMHWHSWYSFGDQPAKAPRIWRSRFEAISHPDATEWRHLPGSRCAMDEKDWATRGDGTCWAVDGGYTPGTRFPWGVVPERWGP